MKPILRDYFRRWWWVWAIVLPVNAAMLVSECVAHQRGNYTTFFPMGIFLGSVLLAMDLQRGGTRVFLSLPVTVGQLARSWWLAAVALPALAVLLAVRRECARAGKRFAVQGLPQRLRDLAALYGIEQLLPGI